MTLLVKLVSYCHSYIYRNGDVFYGTYTILFVITPFIASLIFTLATFCLTKDCNWNKLLHCLFHLPGLQLIKHLRFLKKLNDAIKDLNSTDEFAKSVLQWIDGCKDLYEDKHWTWDMIEVHIQVKLVKELVEESPKKFRF